MVPMKRKLFPIIFVLILLFAVPVNAAAPLWLYIDGIQQNATMILQNGSIYVPLRFVAEELGCEVSWDAATRTAFINKPVQAKEDPYQLDRPIIETINKDTDKLINQALDLLQKHDFPHYVDVCKYVKGIFEQDSLLPNRNTNGNAVPLACSNGLSVFVSETLTKNSQYATPEIIAGLLAHEATHCMWAEHDPNFNTKEINKVKEYERVAYETELVTLKLVGAPQWFIDNISRWEELYK